MLITTPKGIVCSFQVTVPKPLDFRLIYENVKVRTWHSRFDGFAYFLDLFKFIDYQISRLPFETSALVPFFPSTFLKNAECG